MTAEIDRLTQADGLLGEIRGDIEERRNIQAAMKAMRLRSFAETARRLAGEAQLGTRHVNRATVVKALAERCAADAVDEGQRQGQIARGRPKKSPPNGDFSTLEDLGLKPQRLLEWRKLRDNYTDDDLIDLEREFNEADETLSHKELISGRSGYEQRRSQLSSDWYTPTAYIEAARRVLGSIDLDPASCAQANVTVQAARYYTREDDGLIQPWKGRVWLNPPYQGLAGAFLSRLADAYDCGDVTAGIGLVTALTTDTSWFRRLWDHTLCFGYGRIQFDGEGGSSNTAGSVFIYFGPDRDAFQDEFEQFGAVVERRHGPS